jgi:hypothetical protein
LQSKEQHDLTTVGEYFLGDFDARPRRNWMTPPFRHRTREIGRSDLVTQPALRHWRTSYLLRPISNAGRSAIGYVTR